MSTNPTSPLTVTTWEKHLQHLQQACEWAGIKQGRVLEYSRRLREFWEGRRCEREYLSAVYESSEITKVFDLWGSSESDFPGLKENIARAFEKGPVIGHDELPGGSSGRSRNNLFVYMMAGELLRGGVEVLSIDDQPRRGCPCQGPADIVLLWQDETVNVECKRPQKHDTMSKEAGRAYRQIKKSDRGGRPALIAVDCSLFARPRDPLLESNSAAEAWNLLADRLKELLGFMQIASDPPEPTLVGVLLRASAPAKIRQGISPILSPNGEPFRHYRPDHISAWVGNENPLTSRPGLCKELLQRMKS